MWENTTHSAKINALKLDLELKFGLIPMEIKNAEAEAKATKKKAAKRAAEEKKADKERNAARRVAEKKKADEEKLSKKKGR